MRLGIAIESGGVRGMAAAGALSALIQAGHTPYVVGGCGAGAVVAALWATDGLTFEKTEAFAGCIRLGKISRKRLTRTLRDTFGLLPLKHVSPIIIPAIEVETGAVTVLSSRLPTRLDTRAWSRQALVAHAVEIALSAPGILPPSSWRGRVMVGGGMMQNLLPELLRAAGADQVVVLRTVEPAQILKEVSHQAQALCQPALMGMKPCDAIIVPVAAPSRSILQKGNAERLWQEGVKAAQEMLPQLARWSVPTRSRIVPFPMRP